MNRTPGKWEIFGDDDDGWEIMAIPEDPDDEPRHIGNISWQNGNHTEDAKYIVRAVNCHERLVEAARKFVMAFAGNATAPASVEEIAELLAEAEGRE